MLMLRLSSWLAVHGTGPVLGRLVSCCLPLHHRWQSRQREMAIALEKIQHEDPSFQVRLVWGPHSTGKVSVMTLVYNLE